MDESLSQADAAGNNGQDLTVSIARALEKFLADSSTFACGGSIPIRQAEIPVALSEASNAVEDSSTGPPAKRAKKRAKTEHNKKPDMTKIVCAPITIRWDSSTSIKKITLPATHDNDGAASVDQLVDDTQPATFGLHREEIYDETYRKATKMEPSDFSSNFCPYELGIVDAIAQALLPNAPTKSKYHGVRAELYKLNVYQAPSGLFKPHVDTPRSPAQFGSLVVCLPYPHHGGQLVVRHRGHPVTFDWTNAKDVIQWAAFYSDCEHEVLEVTAGYRITLTYNLYVVRGLGDLAGDCPTMDVKTLPLYREVKNALLNPDFMAQGGILGKFSSHGYAHNTDYGIRSIPAVLKGSDMSIYNVIRALGIRTRFCPVIEDRVDAYESDEEPSTDDVYSRPYKGSQLHRPSIVIGDGYDDYIHDIYKRYCGDREKITWLNGPTAGTEGAQFAFTGYFGNNPQEAEIVYSFCALIFEIPPYPNRLKIANKLGYSVEDDLVIRVGKQ